MNPQIKSRILATLGATMAALVGSQILSMLLASIQANGVVGIGLILVLIAIGTGVLKAFQKSTALWAAFAANVFAFLVINRLFATGSLAPSSLSLIVYLTAIVASYWIALFVALSTIELIAPRINAVKHSS